MSFSYFRSFGHFFGPLVFYLFGPLDSVYGTSSFSMIVGIFIRITVQNLKGDPQKIQFHEPLQCLGVLSFKVVKRQNSHRKSLFESHTIKYFCCSKTKGFWGRYQSYVSYIKYLGPAWLSTAIRYSPKVGLMLRILDLISLARLASCEQ